MAYPTRDDLVAASSVAELSALTSAQQDALRAEAIVSVESHCGQAFEAEGTAQAPVTKILDGSGAETIWLPRRLEQLIALHIDGAAIDTGDVAVSAGGARLALSGEGAAGNYYTRALEIPARASFGEGLGSVEIAGVWGWSACPAGVAAALRLHMEDRALADANALAPTVRSVRSLGLGSISQGNLTATLDADELELSARCRRQLADLIWEGPAGFSL